MSLAPRLQAGSWKKRSRDAAALIGLWFTSTTPCDDECFLVLCRKPDDADV